MADVLAHQAFRAVLMALASPGRPQRLPVADRDQALDLVLEAIWGEVPGRVRVAAGHDAVEIGRAHV